MCANRAHIDEQPQSARTTIRKFPKLVNELKRSIKENVCEESELCGKILNEKEVTERLCEDKLLLMEINERETHDDFLEADTRRNWSGISVQNQMEPIRSRSESEQPTLTYSFNEPNNFDSINATQKQYKINKCNDFSRFEKHFHPLLSLIVT